MAEQKRYAAYLELEGLQELGLALVGTPTSQLVDLIAARVHGANESIPPPCRASSPRVEGKQAPSPSKQAPKRAHHTPTTTTSVASKEDEATLQEAPLPSGPYESITGSSGSSMLPTVLQRGPPVPCHVPQLALPARSFK